MSATVCSIDGCEKNASGYGWCKMHYTRWRRHGDPMFTMRAHSIEDAFARYTSQDGDCVSWIGYADRLGYGLVRFRGRMHAAHRVAWELANGPIPAGKIVDHTCYNTSCVNVRHLRIATSHQNAANRSGVTSRPAASGFRGVYRHGRGWEAAVGSHDKRYYLGTFDTINEARRAVETARGRLFGKFAGRNISVAAAGDPR